MTEQQSSEPVDLEAELEALLGEQVGESVISTVLSMAEDLTLGDLKELAERESGAARITLGEVFSQYAKNKKLVQV